MQITERRALKMQSRLWLIAAAFVILVHLSITFLTTLGAEDWQQCFDASGGYRLPHRFAVRDYPWAKYSTHFIWSLASAAPAFVALTLLRSRTTAVLCAILLAPLMWTVLGDFYLMLGEWFRGETITAQGGYHHCDRKGHSGAGVIRLWLYVSSAIIGVATLAQFLSVLWLHPPQRSDRN